MPLGQLGRYPLFKLLAPRLLNAWIASGQEVVCATGETIFQEGTPGAWVYLVRQGRVRIVRVLGKREVNLGVLQPGDVFGEYALLPPGRNTATCRAACPSRVLRLALAPVRTAFQAMPSVWENLKNWLRLHTLLHFSRGHAFLGFMSAESGLKLLDRMQPVSFAAGQTIQADGLASEHWYLLEQGQVRLAIDPIGRASNELGPGNSFGERALAKWGGLPAAIALTDVKAQCLVRPLFEPGAQPSPALASLVYQSYAPRMAARPESHVWVPQVEEADCGLASLAMVAQRRGMKLTVEELRRRATPGPAGLSLQQLQQLAVAVGIPSQAVRVSIDRLGLVSFPAIAHLSNGHYVVLHDLVPGGMVVGDPASGIVTWSMDLLSRCYSGALLLCAPARGA